MSREARTLLVLGLMSLVAVVVLGGMAHRYEKALERRDDTSATAANREAGNRPAVDTLDAFLRVRRSLRSAIDGGQTDQRALQEVRARALVDSGLSGEQYLELRGSYRLWKSGGGLDPLQAGRLEARRAELEAVDLGRFEELDL